MTDHDEVASRDEIARQFDHWVASQEELIRVFGVSDPKKSDRSDLRSKIEDLIPAPAVSPYIDDWPEDEQTLYRESTGDQASTRIALSAYRRVKIADSILTLLVSEGILTEGQDEPEQGDGPEQASL